MVRRVNTKFYVMAHYSRHIRPGMKIINGGDGNTVAAYDNNKGTVFGILQTPFAFYPHEKLIMLYEKEPGPT